MCAYIAVWSLFTSPAFVLAELPIQLFAGVVFALFLGGCAVLTTEALQKRFKNCCVLTLLLAAPILPLIHPALLKILLSSWAAFELVTARKEIHRWCWPVLVVCGGIALGGVSGIVLEINQVFATLSTMSSPASRLYFVSTLLPMWQPVVDLSVLFILIGSMAYVAHVHAVQRCVVLGALFGSIVTVLQKHGGGEFLLRNQSPFWNGIARLSGSFTDPNAQGVYLCCALIFGVVPLWRELTKDRLQGMSKVILKFGVLLSVVAVIVYAALLGGSRSFFLGVAIWVALTVFTKNQRVLVPTAVVGGVALVVATMWRHVISVQRAELYLAMLPTGARRVFDALSVDRIAETLFSRTVFMHMNWEALREYGVWGIGLGRFRYYSPALAGAAGYDLGGWVDNANNFYLGLATELGILAAVVVLSTARKREITAPLFPGVGVILITVFALLLTGPHVEAPEVGLLYAVILGTLTTPKPPLGSTTEYLYGRFRLGAVTLGVICIGAGVVQLSREFGVYGWEREGHGMHQWLAPFSRVSKGCGCDGNASFTLEVAHASKEDPVSVEVRGAFGDAVQKVFSRPGVQRLTIPCVGHSRLDHEMHYHYPAKGKGTFTIVASRAWSPRDTGGADPRVFGVRLRDRLALDLVGHQDCPLLSTPSLVHP